MFTDNEKKMLKLLVEKEIKEVELNEKKIIDESPQEIVIEEKYIDFLNKLLKKI